jgi:hypothetical protein
MRREEDVWRSWGWKRKRDAEADGNDKSTDISGCRMVITDMGMSGMGALAVMMSTLRCQSGGISPSGRVGKRLSSLSLYCSALEGPKGKMVPHLHCEEYPIHGALVADNPFSAPYTYTSPFHTYPSPSRERSRTRRGGTAIFIGDKKCLNSALSEGDKKQRTRRRRIKRAQLRPDRREKEERIALSLSPPSLPPFPLKNLPPKTPEPETRMSRRMCVNHRRDIKYFSPSKPNL